MKLVTTILALAAGAILLGVTFSSFVDDAAAVEYVLPPRKAGGATPAIEWGPIDLDVPDTMPTYAVTTHRLSEANAVSLAAALGVVGPVEWDRSAGAYHVRDADSPYVVVASEIPGNLVYADPANMFATVQEQPDLPSPEEGYRLGLAFLAARGLLPAEGVGEPSYYHNDQVEVNTLTGTRKVLFTNLQVRFGRSLDGVPAVGPGTKLYVHFSDGAVVSGVTKSWPLLVEGAREDVLPLADAVAAATGPTAREEAGGACARAVIERVALSYFVPDGGASGNVAFPVYVFTGTCYGADGAPLPASDSYRLMVPAVG